MADTYYDATHRPDAPARPSLSGRHDVDVCIVGGGFAGLNTAIGLVERGAVSVALLEARRIGHGASGRNGGFVFGGFSLDEAMLLRELGPHRARALYRGTLDAVSLIRHRSQAMAIDCELVDAGVVWANWFRDSRILRDRQALLSEHFGVRWEWLSRTELRDRINTERYSEGLFERDAFHFHPLKYARGIAAVAEMAGVSIHENTPAVGLEPDGAGWRIRTPSGEVRARHVVLACGGYLAGLRKQVDAAVLPIATYAMATEPLGARMAAVLGSRAAVYDTRFAFDYYRPMVDSRLLWGGRISVRDRSPEAVKRLLYRDMLKVFPQLEGVRIEHAWSGLMSYARHQMPQVGMIEPGLWLAQAFGGHGVAPTTFAGELVAAGIAEGDERWRELSGFGLQSAFKPVGYIGAQLAYWWAQAKDGLKAVAEEKRTAH
ncbi:NAD(P)/FAD-dependent oxidoreductase [Novilysobacter spongiicola]|uniref:NAD(P)/FAD-dependent oxidoreductase n=1 Tax=Novilysobacter spongiicola TaxID=435289 RepID=UPI00099A982F|nr:FAD-binding oxidoreductase [Lysobacter spongiicola]